MPRGVYKRGKEHIEICRKAGFAAIKKMGGSPMKGKKHSPLSMQKRTELRRRKYNGAYSGKIGEMPKGWVHPNKGKPGIKRSVEARIKQGNSIRGNKHYRWGGGVKSFYGQIRSSQAYRAWRKEVFARDDYTCVVCGIRGNWIEAHHKDRFVDIIHRNNIKSYEQSMECMELWDIENGSTLCKKCHDKTKFWGRHK